MHTKQRENIPHLTNQDAVRYVTEAQKHYGVIIQFKLTTAQHNGKLGNFTFFWEVKRLTGTKGYKTIASEAVDYPSRQFATFPAMVVQTVSKLCNRVEEVYDEERRAIAQLPLFSDNQE